MPDPIKIYTDGGCDKNPGGTGGWAYRIKSGKRVTERSGRILNTTNNRMELTAAIEALNALKSIFTVELYTDSQYLSRGMTEWIGAWQARNWRLKDGSPVKNVDLWQKLLELDRKHQVTWQWVRGHADDPDNVYVDKMVRAAMKGKVVTERSGQVKVELPIPAVKVNKVKGKPVSVTISQKPGRNVGVDAPISLKVEAKHLQKLIEDLVKALHVIEGD